jgi:hypothetical protein
MGFEASGYPCTSLYPFTASTILSLPHSLHMKRERGAERGERKRRKIGKNTRISKVLPSLPPRAMVEQD